MEQPSCLNPQEPCILVLDDHEDSLEGLCIAVRLCGFGVLAASDGRRGLEMARKAKPHLILCDVRMPGMDGFEFIERLHAEPSMRQVPVVAMSGLASREDLLRTRAAGFAGHLTKPVDLSMLAVRLRRFLLLSPTSSRTTTGLAP